MKVDLVHAGGGGRTQAGSSRHWKNRGKNKVTLQQKQQEKITLS